MSAGKRGRIVGLLFALAVIFGGVGAAVAVDDPGSARSDAILMSNLNWDWE
jgi:hypothetical protein